MEGKLVLILALTAAIGGLSADDMVKPLILSFMGHSLDSWTVLALIVTIIVVICAIVSLQISDNKKIPMILTVVVLIIWIIFFFKYIISENGRKIDIMSALIYMAVSGSALALHVITGSWKNNS